MDENEKTQRGAPDGSTLPFDETAKVTSAEDAALKALADGAGDEELPFTVEKNADGFYVVKSGDETVAGGAYYSDEATAQRVAAALSKKK